MQNLLDNIFSMHYFFIAHLDRNFRFLRVNEAYAHAGNHPKEFFRGKNHFDLYPNEENKQIFQQVVDTGELFEIKEKLFEYLDQPEKDTSYWDGILQPLNDSLGNVETLLLFLHDTTERVRSKLKYRKSENMLRDIAANYPKSYISIIEKNLTIGFTSGREFQKLKLDPNSYIGLSLDEIFGDQTPIVKKHYLKAFAGEENEFELTINNQYQLYQVIPLHNKRGQIEQILVVVEDITEKIVAEQKINSILADLTYQANVFSFEKKYHSYDQLCEKNPKFLELLPQSNSNKTILFSLAKKLKESLEKLTLFAQISEQSPNPMMRITAEGEVLFHNNASALLLEWWGFSENYIHNPKIVSLLQSSKNSSEVVQIDVEVEDFIYWISFKPIKNTSFLNIYGVDITERELAVEKRISAEQQYSNLFNHMIDGSALHKIVLDASGHPIDYVYIDINSAFTKMLGLTREMVIGKKFAEVFPGIREDPTNPIQRFGNVALNDETISFKINFEPLQKIFEVAAFCPKKEYFVTVFRDITMTEKLEKEREKLIYTLNERVKELQCLFNFSEVSEKNASTEEYFTAFLVEIQKAWQHPSVTYARIVIREKSYTTPNYQPTPWVQKEDIIICGKKLGYLEVGYLEKKLDEDEGPFFKEERNLLKMLAERISLFIERRQAETEIKTANKELEAFSYSVSHDLRSPLRGIDGFSQAILEDYSSCLDATGKDYLHRIRTGVQRMGGLINDMLVLSCISRVDLHETVVDLSDMVRTILDGLKDANPNRQIEIAIQEKITSRCDRHLIKIVFQNLLENAWKFSREISKAKIEFGMMKKENKIFYYVQDNGAGFDMVYYDKLFTPFQRLHSSQEFEGTGIGLSTIQRIIHKHKGEIWAKGKVGEGARFYFTLK
ncbi:MAG: PAS domain-containing protein [Promethearchaeota archaeon]